VLVVDVTSVDCRVTKATEDKLWIHILVEHVMPRMALERRARVFTPKRGITTHVTTAPRGASLSCGLTVTTEGTMPNQLSRSLRLKCQHVQ
jgi:hypothetical protein